MTGPFLRRNRDAGVCENSQGVRTGKVYPEIEYEFPLESLGDDPERLIQGSRPRSGVKGR